MLDFGPVGVGGTSAAQIATFTYQSLLVSGTPITGWAGGGFPAGSPFHGVQTCAAGLDPGASCEFRYTFQPTASGVFTATSTVSNRRGVYEIELRGTGVGASLAASPLVLDFGPVPVGSTSAEQVVTIRNTGMALLSDWAGGGPGTPSYATQNCAGGVAPGGTCQFFFRFAPTAPGRYRAVSHPTTNGGTLEIVLYGGEMQHVYLPAVRR